MYAYSGVGINKLKNVLCKCGHHWYMWHRAAPIDGSGHAHDCFMQGCKCSGFEQPATFTMAAVEHVANALTLPAATYTVNYTINGNYDPSIVTTAVCIHIDSTYNSDTSTLKCLACGATAIKKHWSTDGQAHSQWVWSDGSHGKTESKPESTEVLQKDGFEVSKPDIPGITLTEPLKRKPRYPKAEPAVEPTAPKKRVCLYEMTLTEATCANSAHAIVQVVSLYQKYIIRETRPLDVECRHANSIYTVRIYAVD